MSEFAQNDVDSSHAPSPREKAYGSFTQRLLSRELRAGQFVSQRELVDLTGSTLAAVRELIPRLETEGLIRTVPKRGMQIAHVDLNLIRDAFQFRGFLECEAVALFSQQVRRSEIDRLQRDHRDIIAACRAAEDSGGIPAELIDKAQAVDWNLHDTIIESLGNRIVEDAYRVNKIKIRLIRQEQTQLNDSLVISTMLEHTRIVDAIAARELDAASVAMRDHIDAARIRALDRR